MFVIETLTQEGQDEPVQKSYVEEPQTAISLLDDRFVTHHNRVFLIESN